MGTVPGQLNGKRLSAWQTAEARRAKGYREILTLGGNTPVHARGISAVVAGPAKTCQYPVSEGRPWRFCGAPTKSGSSYCEHHHAVCHRATADES